MVSYTHEGELGYQKHFYVTVRAISQVGAGVSHEKLG